MFTRNAIDLYDKYNSYVKDCFGASALFNRALKEAFEYFLQQGHRRTASTRNFSLTFRISC